MFRSVEILANPEFIINTSDEKRVRDALTKLQKSLDLRSEQDLKQREEANSIEFKTPLKRVLSTAPIPLTPLGSILESINLEESPEEGETELSVRKTKKLRRSSKMKVGGDAVSIAICSFEFNRFDFQRRSVSRRRSSRTSAKFISEWMKHILSRKSLCTKTQI